MSDAIQTHFENLLRLIDLEREAEKEENKRELERFPLAVRESLGKTVSRLTLLGEDVGTGGLPLLVLGRDAVAGALSPFHSMNQGDNVRLSFAPSAGLKSMDGTLYDVSESNVTVALNQPAPDPLPNGSCQLDLLGSDATYKRMRQAIGQVMRTGRAELLHLRDVALGTAKAERGDEPKLVLFNPRLNKFQIEAAQRALAAEDVALIHGPPGTGKTTVLVEVIRQAAQNHLRILASAPSNIAVDNMVEKLLPAGLRIVRVGHPARVMEDLHHVTLAAQQEDHPGQAEIRRMDDERHRLINQLRRGRNMERDEKREMKGEIELLWKTARDQEFAIRREIVRNAQVVLSTHGSVGGLLAKERFDVVVMDEASQATEPLSWIPVTLGKKAVFAGDANQLPPTLYSTEAAKKGLSTTLFDRLRKILPPEHQALLRVQYRMNETIMRFSSRNFYDDKLVADDSVKSHLPNQLANVQSTPLTSRPFVYIDTAGTGYEEQWNELLESRENEGEVRLVTSVISKLMEAGVSPNHMAVLSPYVAQVKKLRLTLADRGIEIGSVDSFQGREKEIVVLSLVRSNDKGEVGFLGDTRRMNVAMTRARRLLVVIGDSSTIGRHPFYTSFLDYANEVEAHQSAWEWMEPA